MDSVGCLPQKPELLTPFSNSQKKKKTLLPKTFQPYFYIYRKSIAEWAGPSRKELSFGLIRQSIWFVKRVSNVRNEGCILRGTESGVSSVDSVKRMG